MENNKRSGGRFRAMEGKGFYIVLFLCAAVIGLSAWVLLSDAGTNVEANETADHVVDVSDAIVTMLPAGTQIDEDVALETASEAASVEEDADETAAYVEEDREVLSDAVVGYVWPVMGSVEAPYSVQTLLYDATMADWRTHDGIDIACMQGDEVVAAANGTVVSVESDDLYGTTVEIDHLNGVHSVYANLASEPPVSEGDVVTMGQVIGSVGGTALAEVNMVPHLHFAMTRDGISADPREYLPGEFTEE